MKTKRKGNALRREWSQRQSNSAFDLSASYQKQYARTVDSVPLENNDINYPEFPDSSKHRRLKR